MRSLTYWEKEGGSCLYLPLLMFAKSCSLFESQKGGLPVKHSYMTTPSRYQSRTLVCPRLQIISGARYAVEPQNECANEASLLSPKSVRHACPSISIIILLGFKSL